MGMIATAERCDFPLKTRVRLRDLPDLFVKHLECCAILRIPAGRIFLDRLKELKP